MRTLTRHSGTSTWTNALHNRCYMCIRWTRALNSVVITWQSIPPISQLNSCVMDSRESGHIFNLFKLQIA